MVLSVLDRLEEIRINKGLNKSQFEKVLGKSTGYVNTLYKNQSVPGTEVIIKISDNYPEINLNWLLKGEGEMLKDEYPKAKETHDQPNTEDANETLRNYHADLKNDLKALADGITGNLQIISRGIMKGLQGQQEILDFIGQLNAEEIKKASRGLEEFLEKQER